MLKKISLSILLACLGLVIASQKVHAASIDVGTGCSLSNAINSVNNAADTGGCAATGAYGTSDTITIPAGTVTLSADLPAITKSLVISGASSATTTVNANGNMGFNANESSSGSPLTKNITIQDLSIINADDHAIKLWSLASVTLDHLDVSNSKAGVNVYQVTNNSVSNVVIHDNDSTDTAVTGLFITATALTTNQVPVITISDCTISDNNGKSTGAVAFFDIAIFGHDEQHVAELRSTVHNSVFRNNHGQTAAGFTILTQGGPVSDAPLKLLVDATTISGNRVVTPEPVDPEPGQLPLFSGILVSAKLAEQQNFTNVTVAYNTLSNPAPDTRNSVAGMLASLAVSGANLSIVNATVVGNTVDQPSAVANLPAFFAEKIDFDLNTSTIVSAQNGSSAVNTLIAQNYYNGVAQSCLSTVPLSLLGLLGTIDTTPTNLGHNMSDDHTCTGYTYVPNLYDTIDHEVKDNGGPVPTIALHSDSPAIDGGGEVLGISTDARGVARTGHYSVGAYQGAILAASTTVSTAGQLAKTGLFVALATPIGIFLIALPFYLLWDYRRHKAPLLAADPAVDYSFWHHLKVVTVPVAKYRLSFSLEHKLPSRSDHLSRF